MRIYGPLEHYQYAILDKDCGCTRCVEWRDSLSIHSSLLELTLDHTRNCKCSTCLERRQARSDYLAALNRRDLYCESSWHAAGAPRDDKPVSIPKRGPAFMEWLVGQITSPERPRAWWENRAPEMPLVSWFRSFELSKTMSMSGMAA